uniref:Solute carrier family 37 member 1 n=1 Tax=Oryctolagus cuniculus TaxID=9986 RepID=G1U302_RABIT
MTVGKERGEGLLPGAAALPSAVSKAGRGEVPRPVRGPCTWATQLLGWEGAVAGGARFHVLSRGRARGRHSSWAGPLAQGSPGGVDTAGFWRAGAPEHRRLNLPGNCGDSGSPENSTGQPGPEGRARSLTLVFLSLHSGIIGERLPIRYYLTFGMLASGACTALFGLGYFYDVHSLGFYVVTQVVNGLVQTTGWPSVVTCLGNWFGKGRRGLIMGVWNSHTSVGNILGSLIAGYWVSTCWGLSFVVPGAIVAAMGIVCFLFLIEHPKDIRCSSALPAVSTRARRGREECALTLSLSQDPEMQCLLLSDSKSSAHASHMVVLPGDSGSGVAAISFLGALRIPGVIEFSLCLLFAKLVSYTFLFWLPLYITSVDHLDAKRAGELSTLFDVGGIFGGILAGMISDRLEKRASTCGLMLLLAAPTHCSALSTPLLPTAMLLLSGALVSGPYALITTAVSADLGTHKSLKGNSHALSTVTAIIDGTGSVGAALGPLLAGLLSPSGWSNVFYMLMLADACALLFLTRLIHKELSCPGPVASDQAPLKEH